METVSLLIGNVMDTLIVWMARMSITDVLLGPALLHFSAVIMETASIVHGSAMVTMTAEIWVTRETAPRSLSGAPAGSGNVLATAFVSISAKCVIMFQIVLTELMSHLCVVSYSVLCMKACKSSLMYRLDILDQGKRLIYFKDLYPTFWSNMCHHDSSYNHKQNNSWLKVHNQGEKPCPEIERNDRGGGN